jgi:hypothetical protein
MPRVCATSTPGSTLAKHSKPAKRRPRSAVFTCAAAAGISSTLVLGQAPAASAATPAGTAIGVGGWRDPTGSRVEQKFQYGVVPAGWVYIAAEYPAEIPIDPSVEQGVPVLDDKVADTPGKKLIIGYSEGAVVAELEKRILTDRLVNTTAPGEVTPPDPGELGLSVHRFADRAQRRHLRPVSAARDPRLH